MKTGTTTTSAKTPLHDGQTPPELPGYSPLHCCGFLLRQLTPVVTLSDSSSESEYENTQVDVAVTLRIPQCFDRDLKRHLQIFFSLTADAEYLQLLKYTPLVLQRHAGGYHVMLNHGFQGQIHKHEGLSLCTDWGIRPPKISPPYNLTNLHLPFNSFIVEYKIILTKFYSKLR